MGTLLAPDHLALFPSLLVHSLRQKLSHVTIRSHPLPFCGPGLQEPLASTLNPQPAVLTTELMTLMMPELQGLSPPGTPSETL